MGIAHFPRTFGHQVTHFGRACSSPRSPCHFLTNFRFLLNCHLLSETFPGLPVEKANPTPTLLIPFPTLSPTNILKIALIYFCLSCLSPPTEGEDFETWNLYFFCIIPSTNIDWFKRMNESKTKQKPQNCLTPKEFGFFLTTSFPREHYLKGLGFLICKIMVSILKAAGMIK